jgi:hypothetical protein
VNPSACILIVVLFLAAPSSAEQTGIDDPAVDKVIRKSVKTLAAARTNRIRSDIELIRKVPPVREVKSLEDFRAALATSAAIQRLGNARAVEAIPVLLENLMWSATGSVSVGVPPDLADFPAAFALTEIGPTALPGLIEKAKNLDTLPDVRITNPASVDTHIWLLRVMHRTASEAALVDEELQSELQKLQSVKEPTVDTHRQIKNLKEMVEGARQLQEKAAEQRRVIQERMRKPTGERK